MIVKCKPVYLFQSIEFDWDVKSPKDLEEMFGMYERILKGLIRIAPEQQKQTVNREPPATTKQKEIMKAYGIPFTSTTTMSEASALIKASKECTQE